MYSFIKLASRLAKRLDELGLDPVKEPVPRYSDVGIFRLSKVLQITLISER